MTMQTTIKPILKYPGAKWNLAAWIISHFPAHAHYVEPYFGSGAVFFNKAPAKHEVINDLSGDVVNLFRVIRDDGERLAALIEMTPWAREEYELSYTPTDDPMERARRFLVRCWQGHKNGGLLGKDAGWVSTGTTDNRFARPVYWSFMPCQITDIAKRLQTAEIDHKDATHCIKRHAAANVLIYADPPYPESERTFMTYYQHEMTDADHAALLDALDVHPGPVVLSGYHCALYDTRLAHWHTREKVAQAEKGNTRTEVLWLNQVCIDRLGYGPMFEERNP
jgi:DNA adenine methylase